MRYCINQDMALFINSYSKLNAKRDNKLLE